MFNAPSADDGLELYPWLYFGIGQDAIADRVLLDPRLNPSERTFILVTIGQSLICNSVQWPTGTYTPTNGNKVQNFNFIDGGLYTARDDLLGCHGQGANPALWVADWLIDNNKADRVICVPIGFSSTGSGQWSASGNMNHRIPVLAKRLRIAGYTPTAILWQQGTADASAGASTAVTRANLQSMIDTFRASGISSPILIAKESYYDPDHTSVAATRAAQAAVVNSAAGVYAGPDCDLIPASERFDNLHFGYTGAAHYAQLAGAALSAVVTL